MQERAREYLLSEPDDEILDLLHLPIMFSNAREFTFAASASFGRGRRAYLFDAIFILAMAYPLLMLFAEGGATNVRNGSKGEIPVPWVHFRFASESRLRRL